MIVLRSVQWPQTIGLNLLRAFGAGFTVAMLLNLAGYAGLSSSELVLLPVIAVVAYLCFYLPLGLVCGFLGRYVPFVGLLTVLCSLVVILGDPWLFIVHKWRPHLIPAQKFNFLNFCLILFIEDPAASTP